MMKYENLDEEYDTNQIEIKMQNSETPKTLKFHDVESNGASKNGIADPAENLEFFMPETFRSVVRRIVEHIIFRVFGLLLILLDVTILIVDLATGEKSTEIRMKYDIVALVFGTYFILEVSVRMYGKGVREFFQAWYNVIDLVIIIVSYIVTIVYTTVELNHTGYARLIVLGRLVRIMMFVRLCTERKHIEKGARHVVSQNKRRYRKDGFDLDLTYVTEHVIAMSFPSSGKMSLYRNPIGQVAKFFNTKHADHYRIYNLCSERTYDTSFFHGRVRRFIIDDHNVPLLRDMIGFCNDVEQWLNADQRNVIAVHCKGGKGRTGSMICVWLIHCNLFESALDSLGYFGDRRTDLKVGNKFQGVETPSQNRYVGYFSEIHSKLNGQLPEPKTLQLKTIIITSVAGIGAGNGSDMWCEIFREKEKLVTCTFGSNDNCVTKYDGPKDVLTIDIENCLPLEGDIRIKFHCASDKVPKNYENCPFYFWFYTSFIEDNKLYIPREELDNPHKPKTWNVFREKFGVELLFDDSVTK